MLWVCRSALLQLRNDFIIHIIFLRIQEGEKFLPLGAHRLMEALSPKSSDDNIAEEL